MGQVTLSELEIASESERKRDLEHIQWFVVIACSYLLVVQDDRLSLDSLTLALLIGPFTSMLVFLRLPQSVFNHRYFPSVLAAVDTILICTAIIMNRQSPWDLVLVFFFGVLIAAVGENLLQVIGACVIVGILSVVIVPVSTGTPFSLDGNTLLRVPLLLGSALLYGYLADQVKRERRKTAALEETRRQQLLTRDQLFSHVSHELRTPLTAVYQFLSIVLDGFAGALKPEQKEYLEIALRNVKQLQAMVGDLLEAARADSGKLAIHPQGASLNLLVHEVHNTFAANARHKGVELHEDLPGGLPLLYVDPRRLKQILGNLIDNALKFTPSGGKITVRAGVSEENGEFVHISVADTGCGVNSEEANKIFERLYQVADSEGNRKGLGLGLHITRELVVRQGGRIWLESAPGEGAQFHLTLPFFSLKRLLQTLLSHENSRVEALSLIALQVATDAETPADIAQAVQETTWLTLNDMELPQRAALVPNVVMGGERALFHLLQAKDLESARELATRVEKEISRGKQFRGANCQVRSSVSAIALPGVADPVDVDEIAAYIDARISQEVSRSSTETTAQAVHSSLLRTRHFPAVA